MLVGSFLHSVDAKGRVVIPAKHRIELGQSFYINLSHDGCIRAYSEQEWNRVVERLVQSTAKTNPLKRRIFSSTVEIELDVQGRILLPEELRTKAMISDKVRIVGMARWAEFWNPELFDTINEQCKADDEVAFLDEMGLA